MRIALDARQFAQPTRATARYITALTAGLASAEGTTPVLFSNRPLAHLPANLRQVAQSADNLTLQVRFDWLSPVWEQLVLPRRLSRQSIDVWHATFNYGIPLRCPVPSVVTIHDVAQFLPVPRRDALRIPPINWAFLQQFRLAAARADRIIVVSENTKRDVAAVLHADPAKMTVIYEGADPMFSPLPDRDAVALTVQHYGIHHPYLIYAGGLEPRKNLETLLRAYAVVAQTHQADLVVIGTVNAYARRMRQLAQALGLANRVRFPGFVPNADFVALLNGAVLAAYPSWYEGFGLPPLEAMACGVPLIASNSSSIPEVVGDAALLISPADVPAWAAAIRALLDDTAQRHVLVAKGVVRAATFSQAKMVRQTLAVYTEAADR